jgi:hypothetical protein
MNEISPLTWASSPRTADYVSALIREGDNFDYYRWLREARAEETQAKQRPQTTTSGKMRAGEIEPPIGTPDLPKSIAKPGTVRQSYARKSAPFISGTST